MIFVFAAVILPVVSAAVFMRLRECQVRVDDAFAGVADSQLECAGFPVFEQLASPVSEPADVLFTHSLLALSTVGSRVHDGSPAPAPVESSSLVSVPRAQSKNRVLTP